MTKHSFLAAAAIAALVLPATLRADNHASKDIVDTAVAAGDFKTLATALQAAGLVETLKGKGPFTVFAPTDAAFAKIPKADLDALLQDKAKLTGCSPTTWSPARCWRATSRSSPRPRPSRASR